MKLLKALSRLPKAQVRRLLRATEWWKKRDSLAEAAASLEKRLARVRRKLATLEQRIATAAPYDGRRKPGRKPAGRAAGGRRGGRRGQRPGSLPSVLAEVLKKHGKPASIPELAQLAMDAGYKTKSKLDIFKRAVQLALSKARNIKRVARGQYATG